MLLSPWPKLLLPLLNRALPNPEWPTPVFPNVLLPDRVPENVECPKAEEEDAALLNLEPEAFETPRFDPAPELNECEFDAEFDPPNE